MCASAANCAIDYHPDGFGASSGKVMGRQAAGEGFLTALVKHAGADPVYCVTGTLAHFEQFVRTVAHESDGTSSARWVPRATAEELAQVGCLYHPAPDIGTLAWERREHGPRSYSLCGVTHTTCTAAIMDAIGDLLVAPVESWDAIVCTSRAVRASVDELLARQGEYLAKRIGGQPSCPVKLPLIPLGVDCDRFAAQRADLQARSTARERWAIGERDIVVLFVGRLAFHAKAHPLPMYMALAKAASGCDAKIHLIMAGWFPSAEIGEEYRRAANCFATGVNVRFVDGSQPGQLAAAWRSADVFCSLADNVQETFGLTPIEAMASGLPCVVSDWDGYRDTVRHGIDGFRVPTSMPPSGAGKELAWRYFTGADTFDRYVGHSSQSIAVDVTATVGAFRRLFGSAALRKEMGESARRRAHQEYDWRVIIGRYQDLWLELADLRSGAPESAPRSEGEPAHPLRDDPFSTFAGYATRLMDESTILRLMPGADRSRVRLMLAQPLTNFAGRVLGTEVECAWVVDRLSAGPLAVRELLEACSVERRPTMLRTLGWLAKCDLVCVDGLEVAMEDLTQESRVDMTAPEQAAASGEFPRGSYNGNAAARYAGSGDEGRHWWKRLRKRPR